MSTEALHPALGRVYDLALLIFMRDPWAGKGAEGGKALFRSLYAALPPLPPTA